MMIDRADIVVGLAWGDEAKGKISNHLAGQKELSGDNYYSFVCRWNGGSNAGHTIYIDGKVFKTHIIPCGVFHGIKSIIGPNCVLHKDSFLNELDDIDRAGFDSSLVMVAPNCHIVSDEHIGFDIENLSKKLGTTSRGIAPAYASKAARTGVLAKDALDSHMIFDDELSGRILCEGAQGVWLDINMGHYPYVTSSETLPYSACSLGFPTQSIDKIYGAAKIYDTRSGEDPRFPSSLLDDKYLGRLADLGKEFGVTTGRRRKVNWLNLDLLIKSVCITGTTNLIISKCDVLEELGHYRLIYNENIITFSSIDSLQLFIYEKVTGSSSHLTSVRFSGTPYGV